ncbi:MAG: tyrosine-type recombinase/integrase [Planctomycetes bacterium]|nr:tyrosine-type recombinase/integrase [Planctomycetota bacterium]
MFRFTNAEGKRSKKRTQFRGNANGRRDAEKLAQRILLDIEREKHGLVDQSLAYAKLPLEEHLATFEQHLAAREPGADYRDRLMKRLRWVLRGIGAERITAIDVDSVVELLVTIRQEGIPDHCLTAEECSKERAFEKRRRARPKSAKTRDDYLDSLRQFCKWAHDHGRLSTNPAAQIRHIVSKHQPEKHATFIRRPLTTEEVGRLVESAAARGVANKKAQNPQTPEETLSAIRFRGETRAHAYLIAATLGVRAAALCSLTWADLDLETGTMTLRAATSKNGKGARPDMPPWLVEQVRLWKERVASVLEKVPAPTDRVLEALPVPKNIKRLLDKDLEFAGIEPETSEGRVDFHALRTSAATLFYESGIDPKAAAKLLNCGEAVMQRHYARVRRDRLREAASKIPAPSCLQRLIGA